MPGQTVVTIKDKQWAVSIANTYAELTTGLSGIESIPPGTGMLFDLGYNQKFIQIDMTRMLFPLDIIFINSTQGVVGVISDAEPGMREVGLENEILPGARCFLEVNAGEAEGIEIRDSVDIQGYTQSATIDLGSVMQAFLATVIVGAVVGMLWPRSEHHSSSPNIARALFIGQFGKGALK